MAKVIFNVQYEINPEKRDDFLSSVKELKNLVKAEGLESYSVFEVKGKPNMFDEVFIFNSEEAYEQYDDAADERMNVLLSKLEEMKVPKSTRLNTMYEIAGFEN